MKTLLGILVAALLVVFAGVAEAGIVEGMYSPGETPAVPPPPVEIDRTLTFVMIDFDDAEAPCVFASAVPLRDEYLAMGVSFSGPFPTDGGAVLDECGNFGVSGHSSPNFVAFNCNSSMSNGGTPQGPETLTFTDVVSSCSVLVASNSGQGYTLSMDAYDMNEELIASDSVVLTPAAQLLGVDATGIKTVIIGSVQPCVWIMDDLGFDTGFTPVENASWATIKALYK